MKESPDKIRIKRALISSWRKPEALVLAKALDRLGAKISASGGTADAIIKAGINVERLSNRTGFDELLGGRVKTLHPAIYAGILVQHSKESDMEDLKRFDIQPFDLIAVDLYPFPQGSEKNLPIEESVELIDIGGVSLIRAAAKNYKWVSVICSADLFEKFASILEAGSGEIDGEYRRRLAIDAFRLTSRYDATIAERLAVEEQNRII